MADLEVRVLNNKDRGIEGIAIRLGFNDIDRGMSDTEYTDSDGSAYFNGFEDGEFTLYVDHKSEGDYYYGRDSYIEIHLYGHDDDDDDD